jgi:hypothetical protein
MRRRRVLALFGVGGCASAVAQRDPRPHPMLEAAPGYWLGSLTYRDWTDPGKLVTLPCRMAVSLLGPEDLALYLVFDDGPSKVVHSYTRMSFDLALDRLSWSSGFGKPEVLEYRIRSASREAETSRIAFERETDARTDRFTFELSPSAWSLGRVERVGGQPEVFRNRYEFTRSGA